MKKNLFIVCLSIVTLICCAFGLFGCKGDTSNDNDKQEEATSVSVTQVTLNEVLITLDVGESETLIATVKPDNATNKTVAWNSSDPNVATVDGQGKVTAVSAGTATVTATAGGKSAVCTISVNKLGDDNPAVSTAGLEYLPTADETAYICVGLGTATDRDIIIADEYDGLPVTKIKESAFANSEITSITISKNISTIGQYAFKNCTAITDVYYKDSLAGWCNIDFGSMDSNPLYYAKNLYINNQLVTDLIIPSGVAVLQYSAFINYRTAESLVIPESVNTIERGAFRGCSGLKNVKIANGVSSVGDHSFAYCSGLNEITVGEGVASMGDGAFRGCSNLHTVNWNAINCSANSQLFGVFDGCTNLTDVIVGENVIRFSTDYNGAINIFSSCKELKRIAVSENNTVFSGDSGILYNKAETEIVYIPKGIEGEIEIPDSMTRISAYAFNNCTKITRVIIPDTIQSIGIGVFNNCSGLDIYYSGDLASWCAIEFNCSPLASANNFYVDNAPVTKVVIPDSVTALNVGAFSGSTSITSIVIPDSVTFIEENALGGCCALAELTIPFVGTGEKIFGVKYGEFGSIFGYKANDSIYNRNVPHSLKSVVITGETTIADNAFEDCYYIETITLPQSLTSVGYYAFNNCRGLKSVYYSGDLESWCGIKFSSSSSNPLNCAHKLYINGALVTNLVIPENVTKIGSYAFSGIREITNVYVHASVTSIGNDAFGYCGEINYGGTMEQWKAIEITDYWCSLSSSTVTVHCLDGKLDKYGNVKS